MGHSGQMGGEVQGEEDSQVGGVVLWHPSRRALSALATVDDPAAAYGGERLLFERLAQMEIRRPEVELEIGFTHEADLDPLVAIFSNGDEYTASHRASRRNLVCFGWPSRSFSTLQGKSELA
jgi:hypothetical protein